jgi:hypothetical protein
MDRRQFLTKHLAGTAILAFCMGMGQAAAVNAVLAAKLNVTPGDVPIGKVHAELKKQGVIVPA